MVCKKIFIAEGNGRLYSAKTIEQLYETVMNAQYPLLSYGDKQEHNKENNEQ
jgi:hypothetical protein